jgi:hypothetical protein
MTYKLNECTKYQVMETLKNRVCIRVYNLPQVHVDVVAKILDNVPNVKQQWIAKDISNTCVGYCWCEFDTCEDKNIATEVINNMDVHGKRLYVVE